MATLASAGWPLVWQLSTLNGTLSALLDFVKMFSRDCIELNSLLLPFVLDSQLWPLS